METIAPENLKDTRVIKSPCGQYEVEIQNYQVGQGWPYSRIILKKDTVLLSVDRNYGYRGGFFQRLGQTWFWTGKHYQSQIMINLETLEQYESKEKIEYGTFCWAEAKASASGKILAVDGCHWGDSYMVKFYDLSNPQQGWPEIKVEKRGDFELFAEDAEWHWEGEIFVYRRFVPWNTHYNKLTWHLSIEEIQADPTDEDQELDLYKAELEFKETMVFRSLYKNEETAALL